CSRPAGYADRDDSSPGTREAAEDPTIKGKAIMFDNIQPCRGWLTAAVAGSAAVLILGLATLPNASAQSFASPMETVPAPSGVPARALPLMQIEPTQRQSDEPFIRSLSANDAFFEVIIGQGRMLTLDRDIVEPDQPSPLI